MSFAALPCELKQRILLHALQPPHGKLHQAPILAVLSKDCYAIVKEILYRHVQLTKPSTLRQFHDALKEDTALGGLVQSLHIGPVDGSPYQGWPIRVRYREGGVDVLLETSLPQSLLPRWTQPGAAFYIDRTTQHDCQHHAVHLAIKRALEDLDVDPKKRGWSRGRSAREIGIRAWTSRLWQAQAALDLYLTAMRRVDDVPAPPSWLSQEKDSSSSITPLQRCVGGTCRRYPVLDLKQRQIATSSRASRSGHGQAQRLYLSRQQLWNHLTKSGGRADHFDHVILFAQTRRSELSPTPGEWHCLKHELSGPHWDQFDTPGRPSVYPGYSSDEEDWDNTRNLDSTCLELWKGDELLTLARDVLASTTAVTNLSVSSFLHLALDGLRGSQSLRTLTMTPGWKGWWCHLLRHLSHDLNDCIASCSCEDDERIEDHGAKVIMPKLEVLRICGSMADCDARKVATQLPSLKRMELELTTDLGEPEGGFEVISNLQGRLSDLPASVGHDWPKRYTEVRMRPDNLDDLMSEEDLPQEVLSAWQDNRPVPGTLHPVKVTASKMKLKWVRQEDDDGSNATLQYAQGIEWWEQSCVGLGVKSKLD